MRMSARNGHKVQSGRPVDAVILAAGEGKRMAAAGDRVRPKVVYEVAGQPMIRWVVQACLEAGVRRCIVVIGFEGGQVRDALAGLDACLFVEQSERKGTGHATRMAHPLFGPGQDDGDAFVLAGDGPLIRAQTLRTLLETHRAHGAAATLATSVIENPQGYGRVIRDAQGRFERIVEQNDASPAELLVREINPSYYCFDVRKLFSALARVRSENSQGEYYLTDVPGLLRSDGEAVVVVDAVPPQDVLSINTPDQLAEVDRLLRAREARRTAPLGTGRSLA